MTGSVVGDAGALAADATAVGRIERLREDGQCVAHRDDLRFLDVADVLAVDLHRHRRVAADHDPVEVVADEHVAGPAAAQRLGGEPRHGARRTSIGATMSRPPSKEAPGTKRRPSAPA